VELELLKAAVRTEDIIDEGHGAGSSAAPVARVVPACSLYREKDGHLNVELIHRPNQRFTRPTTRPLLLVA
jgi:hypothetical protein